MRQQYPPASISATTALSVTKREKRFSKVAALQGLDLDVAHGSVFGFLGPNGAGKTTAGCRPGGGGRAGHVRAP